MVPILSTSTNSRLLLIVLTETSFVVIVYLLDMNLVQIADGFCQKGDTHGAETSACATGIRKPVDVFDNPIQTQERLEEMKETGVIFIVVEAFVVGDVHLHR